MNPEHPKKSARIGAIIALMGSLVWVQWPIDFEKFNAAALILFVAALVTWISMELSEKPREAEFDNAKNDNVLNDDVNKLNSIIDIIDKNQFYILKHKAIQTYMGENDYKGLRELIYFSESDIFPFHNKEIQDAYVTFADDAKKFHHDFYMLYTYDGQGRTTWRPAGGDYVDEDIFRTIMGKIAKLDQQASALADSWQTLVDLARRELKGASKSINRYEQ